MSPVGPLSLLIAPRCAACDAVCRRDQVICRPCRSGLPWLTGELCAACGLPAPCGDSCPAESWAFSASWAPVAYAGPAVRLIRALKERGSYPAAEFMASAIVAGAPSELLSADAVLVPVPADPWRSRARGIDHAHVLAGAISRRSGNRAVQVLARRHSSRQARLDRAHRVAAQTAISARSGSAPETAVLIDDVHTTGATLHAAASALSAAGSGRIGCLTFGRSI